MEMFRRSLTKGFAGPTRRRRRRESYDRAVQEVDDAPGGRAVLSYKNFRRQPSMVRYGKVVFTWSVLQSLRELRVVFSC